MCDIVKEAIIYGSPFEALAEDFITVTDILEYLLTVDVSNKTLVAYKASCAYSYSQTIVDSDGNEKHFLQLCDHDEYVAIYITMFKDIEAKYKPIIAKLAQRIWFKLVDMNEFSRKIFIVCDVTSPENINKDELWLAVASRSVGIIRTRNMFLMDSAPEIIFIQKKIY
jgi:hypothetical protein